MTIFVLPEADAEFADAADYYDRQQAGLGHRFRDELNHHILWIGRNAEIPRLRRGGYRRVNLKIFPYYIAYVTYNASVWILAIAHGHSRPEYWIRRRPKGGQQSGPNGD